MTRARHTRTKAAPRIHHAFFENFMVSEKTPCFLRYVRKSSLAALSRVKRPMRVMRLLPKSSRLRPSPTDDHSDQTSESDAHGGGHGDNWPSHNERASKVEPQASDRSSLLQLVDRDREQIPA